MEKKYVEEIDAGREKEEIQIERQRMMKGEMGREGKEEQAEKREDTSSLL